MMTPQLKPQFMLIREGPYKHDNKSYFILEPKNIIGRGDIATLPILSLYVSRNQCELCYDEEQNKWFVKDSNSLNGTFINEKRVSSYSFEEIKIDDRLGLGITFNSLIENVQTSNQGPDQDYFVYRLAFSYPYNGTAINSLCNDIAEM
ncbi:hypothetical protein PVAND_012101 [Polypedilum vanderplanki]|uniref:FHA domain-containing protein n=1 Tax=Polypedilum vanderplanki TaxID=319348 RepID=A0A9J6CLD7_POLVA|nr:hypothetical protein PVAND_012101 [Polypedilum vanderplanki]